jgi:H+-transporting ATPase
LPPGLTSDEARRCFAKFGPNAVADTSLHPLPRAPREFWTPVPWILEAGIVLEIVLGKYVEAGIIAVLLVCNAASGLFQDLRAHYGLR